MINLIDLYSVTYAAVTAVASVLVLYLGGDTQSWNSIEIQ